MRTILEMGRKTQFWCFLLQQHIIFVIGANEVELDFSSDSLAYVSPDLLPLHNCPQAQEKMVASFMLSLSGAKSMEMKVVNTFVPAK